MSGSWFTAWRVLISADLIARQVKIVLADLPLGEHMLRSVSFTMIFGLWWWATRRAERRWSTEKRA